MRSKFNLSHYRLTSMDMGYLIPVGLVEVLPGDTFRASTSALVRLSPLAAPIMHPIEVRVHHFFVPHRLTWDGWEDFITGGPDGNDASVLPTVATQTIAKNSVYNYYGIPAGTVLPDGAVSAIPSSGYGMIYNEYFRDQDLVPEWTSSPGATPRRIAWEKDYFTAARPWLAKGTATTVPLSPLQMDVQTGTPDFVVYPGTTVDEFRKAFALHRYQEARARYGSRYTEYLRYLGIRPSDSRLDRPEYLGGGKVTLSVSEVLQTAPEGSTPARDYGVADMYGHGVGAVRTRPYRRFFEEHGYVHVVASVRPKTIYQDAVPRHWLKSTKEEFWQKELQNIGQQEVFNMEVYSAHSDWKGTFGYMDRYMEYHYQPSQVSGDFEDTLNYWHMARKFTADPALNQTFVECDPTKRVFNEQTQNSVWCSFNHRIVARRLAQRTSVSAVK